jgi:protein ImuB
MLWLSLHLATLPLEVFSRGLPLAEPAVVAEGEGQRLRVSVANRAARRLGIEAGMTLQAARCLTQDLRVFRRDVGREARALEGLAAWAGQWTPHVSLESDGLLLEISGSLRLFGGVSALLQKIRKSVVALGYRPRLAVAPTALAALWLARAGREDVLTEAAQLTAGLAGLPVHLAQAACAHTDLLEALGVITLGDCLALPREGLARRFGEGFLDELDRALGLRPDPRAWFEPPACFRSRLELPMEVAVADALLFAARRLLGELEGFLRARDAGVERFRLDLVHGEAAVTAIEVGLVRASRDGQRLSALLRERLAGTSLAEPVRALVLTAERVVPYRARNLELFPEATAETENAASLIERLRARLGEGKVYGLECVADHRPERAMKSVEPGRASSIERPSRPLWLLARPRRLLARGGLPRLGAPLVLREGPERIESGWWDGQAVARDYFVAEAAGGARYWVYREAGDPEQWFVHGIFA